ncbi:MAG: GTPase Era [bacterium]
MNKQQKKLKSGFITIIGRSNVGKSTLMNTMIGTKIAGVSTKAQTTRSIIHGVINNEKGQAVLIDTPGVFKHKKNLLSGKLLKRVRQSLQDIDIVLYMVDPSREFGEEERYAMSIIRKINAPKILAINKCDLPEKQKPCIDDYRDISDEFSAVFEISALKNRHIKPLVEKIFELLPEGPAMYPDNQLTNLSTEEWIAEIILEKIFNLMRQEAPYTSRVEVESMEEKKDIIVVKATIFTTHSRYKKMLIGKNGRAIKEIGTSARKELETALNKKIYLELEVEVDAHWEERV